jgi:hypothetical protein
MVSSAKIQLSLDMYSSLYLASIVPQLLGQPYAEKYSNISGIKYSQRIFTQEFAQPIIQGQTWRGAQRPRRRKNGYLIGLELKINVRITFIRVKAVASK